MSSEHDTSPSPEDARALGRWLDRPGEAPPESLDPEVVEAVYALRPDLAPAPSLTAEDILGDWAGPTQVSADPSQEGSHDAGADIVPFPGRDEPAPQESDHLPLVAPAARGTTARWAGGIGGAGLALVAAATLLLTVFPSSEVGQGTSLVESAPAATAPQRKMALQDQVAEVQAKEKSVAGDALFDDASDEEAAPARSRAAAEPSPPRAELRQAVAEPAVTAPVEEPDAVEAFDMSGNTALSQRGVIPEAEEVPVAVREDLDLSALDEAAAGFEAEGNRDRAVERSVPAPKKSSWRTGVPPATASAADAALSRASQLARDGDPAAGATLLMEALNGPAPVAYELALRAAELFLDAGDASSARAALARAAEFGEPTSDQARRARRLSRKAAE